VKGSTLSEGRIKRLGGRSRGGPKKGYSRETKAPVGESGKKEWQVETQEEEAGQALEARKEDKAYTHPWEEKYIKLKRTQ